MLELEGEIMCFANSIEKYSNGKDSNYISVQKCRNHTRYALKPAESIALDLSSINAPVESNRMLPHLIQSRITTVTNIFWTQFHI